MRPLGILLAVTLSLAAAPALGASKSEKVCLATFKGGQDLEGQGHLRQAQQQYQTCAKATCGTFIKQQCSLRYTQLENDIPSVVPVALDEGGNPISEVKVSMDGEPLASKIDGRSLLVDPGLHEFSFQTAGGALSTQKILIMQGQRNRPITVEIAVSVGKASPSGSPLQRASLVNDRPAIESTAGVTVDADPMDHDDPGTPALRHRYGVAPWVAGGVGLAGVGGYALLTFWGRKDNDLLGNCTPQCPQASVDRVKKLYLMANISLGVGAVALAGATYLFIRNRATSSEVATRNKKHPAYAVDVQPLPSGAVASLRGAF
jgi:hypothetical protein